MKKIIIMSNDHNKDHGCGSRQAPARRPGDGAGAGKLAGAHLSNAACQTRPRSLCVLFGRVEDRRHLPHDSPLLKNTCVRQASSVRQVGDPEKRL